MEREFVPYERALKLKALGFNEHCLAWYDINNILFSDITIGYEAMDSRYIQEDMNAQQCTAPTFSQAFRWFREKGYDVKVVKESPGLYFGFYWTGAAWITVGAGTYEGAESACLDKLIEIALNYMGNTRVSTTGNE